MRETVNFVESCWLIVDNYKFKFKMELKARNAGGIKICFKRLINWEIN